jgi:hypothetical protein
MAKQKGIFPLVGTLDGVNYYIRKGKAVARKAGGGFTGKAIKTKPSMVRVRENNSEFGHCSQVKKGFKIALTPFLKHYADGTLHGRMMQLFQEIKAFDSSSLRGSRSVGLGILTASGKELFQNFVFNPLCNVSNVVPMKGIYNKETGVYAVHNFDINRVRFPKNATHLELQYGVIGVDFESLEFKLCMAPPLVLQKEVAIDDFEFEPEMLPEIGWVRLAFVGVAFYQEVNGVRYVLKEEGNVGVACVG